MTIHQWATKHGVTLEALHELQGILGMHGKHLVTSAVRGTDENSVLSAVRLEAARKGIHLWRNNVGVLNDVNGRPVRYGLANDSKQLNAQVKSGDLIGWRPLLITPALVGHKVAQFVSRECKRPDWQYKGDERERAQLAWAQLVLSAGGDACFVTGEGTL